MTYSYATQDLDETMAKAVKVSAQISFKQSVEMGSWLKGRTTTEAIHLLNLVQDQNVAVPAKKFNRHYGHKKGIGPGRYPVKTSLMFIEIINAVVANAAHQGLDTKNLVIHNIVANKGAKSYKQSRMRGLKAKNTHLEIVVAQKVPKAKVAKKVAAPKAEASAEKSTKSESK